MIFGENEEKTLKSPKGDDDAFFLKAKRWFIDDAEGSSKWRECAEEDFRFLAGDQWDEESQQLLKEQLRPCITFNRILPVIKTVSGSETNNRQEIRYIPRTLGDAKVNEVFTAASKWARDESFAEDKESDAFLHLLTCGMGWTEETIDFEEDPEGKPAKNLLDPMEMFWDYTAQERNLRDSRRRWRVRDIPLDDAREMFGEERDVAELDATWARNWAPRNDPHDADKARFYEEDQSGRDGDREPDMVTLVHLQWWERKTYHRLIDPITGQTTELEAGEFDRLNSRLKKLKFPALKSAKLKKRVYYQAFIGGEVLERDELLSKKNFTFQCMTGERDHMNKMWFGLVRTMKDPQRWMNKFFSQILHIVNTTAIPGWMAEQNTFTNIRQAEKDMANPQRIVELQPGGSQRIVPKQQNRAPPELFQLLEFTQMNIRDTVGVNLELMGMRDVNQPGVLEYQRKQAAMTVLATLFDNLRSYRKVVGQITLGFIQDYFSDGRLIRIVGEEGEKYVPLRKIPGVVEFDVIVDEAPSAPNQKEQAWAIIQQMLPVIGEQMTPELWATILDYTPLPASLVEKVKEQIAKKQQQPPPPDPMAKKAEAEVQKIQMQTQAHAQKAQIDAQSDQQQAQMEQQKAQSEAQVQQRELALKGRQLELRERELAMEAEFKALDHSLKMDEMRQRALMPRQPYPAPGARPTPAS